MENCPKGLKFAFSGHKEIHPCVLQDIGPLGPLERANFRPHRAYFRPERAEYKPGRVDLWPKLADFWPKRTDFGPKKVDFGSERADFGPERGDFRYDLGLLGLISGLKEPDLGLRGLGEGGTYGRTDVRTDVRTDGRNFSPFYRTSSPVGAAAQ